MKLTTLATSVLAAAVLSMGSAYASPQMATKNKCNLCHAMDKKMVGPSWKEIAAKNKGAKDADKTMAAIIVSGNKGGKYGKVAMPPQPGAKVDAPALAKWILSL